MAAPTDNQPTYEISDAPWPERRKLGPWQITGLIAGGLVVAFLAGTGAVATVQHYTYTSVAKVSAPATHKAKPPPKPTTPTYDLAGFKAALAGPEEQAFASALWALRTDIKRPDYTAATADAPKLIAASGNWLALLRTTKPPPAYVAQRLTYEQVAEYGREAGKAMQIGLSTGDLSQVQLAANYLAQARALSLHSAQPTGS